MTKLNVEERAERARSAFLNGYNCSQAVVMAYADITDNDPEKFAAIVEPLGGGMGRLREVCGAVTGMFIISGTTHWGKSNTDPPKYVPRYTPVYNNSPKIPSGERQHSLSRPFGSDSKKRLTRTRRTHTELQSSPSMRRLPLPARPGW